MHPPQNPDDARRDRLSQSFRENVWAFLFIAIFIGTLIYLGITGH